MQVSARRIIAIVVVLWPREYQREVSGMVIFKLIDSNSLRHPRLGDDQRGANKL